MELSEARKQIDELDRSILTLFVQRMEVVDSIAAYKLERNMNVFDPGREAQLLREAAKLGGDQFADCTRRLMEQMLMISREYQEAHQHR